MSAAKPLHITVRGSAKRVFEPQRATISLAVSVEGDRKDEVARLAAAVQQPLTADLAQRVATGAVSTWHGGHVQTGSYRPYLPDGRQGQPLHTARLQCSVEFVDFHSLSEFVGHWSGVDGVEFDAVEWDLLAADRRDAEAQVRAEAVQDAVRKAQEFSDAVGAGVVNAVELSDPGMLNSSESSGSPEAMYAMRASDHGTAITLTREPIEVQVRVDARFYATPTR